MKKFCKKKFYRPFILAAGFWLLVSASVCAAAEQIHGLWVECEGTNETLASLGKLRRLIQISKDSGVNAIFLQVNRHNRSWYKSDFSDNTPFDIINAKYKLDPLDYIISNAHRNGIKAHAWINIYRIGKDAEAPVIKKLGKDVITRDGKGRSLLQYPYKKLPDGGYWLDPGDPAVKEYLLKIISEVIEKYPKLDGIHLDYIRYPYLDLNPGSRFSERRDFGYGRVSVERFKLKNGYSPLTMDLNDRDKTQLWDDWRREQVTNFISEVYKVAKTKNPNIQVSCAVQPWIDRSYMVSYQDWPSWINSRIVDFVVIMNYSIDRKLVRYLSESALALNADNPVYIGLGAYLLISNPVKLYLQISDCQELKAKGIVLFSYDALLKNKNILREISKNKWWTKQN